MNIELSDEQIAERLLMLWLAERLKEFREAVQGSTEQSSSEHGEL